MVALLTVLLGTSILGIVIGIGSYVYYDVNNKKIEAKQNENKKRV